MTRIVLHPSGRTVECAAGDTVLGALEKSGYALPNNCRAGACGECKVRVCTGQFDQGMVLDMALSAEERKQGFGLMCMAKPLSEELVIEWGTEDALPKLFAPRENQLYVLVDRTLRTPRIAELRLRPVGQAMRFWPGQYVLLGEPRAQVPPRSYSIANAPRPDGEILLQVTRVDGGATSLWLHERLKVGDTLKLSGPYGTFIGDPSANTPVLCLAAGSGLAPILALSEAALRRGYRQPVTLLFSARTAADVYDRGMMAWWETKHRNFNYKVTLTGEQQPGLLHGRIPEILPTLFKNLANHSIFIAGSPSFVADCTAAVKKQGAQQKLIHTEAYFPKSEPVPPPREKLAVENPNAPTPA